jgi:aminopeptidase N
MSRVVWLVLAAGSIAVARPDDECCGGAHRWQPAPREIGSFDPATGRDLRTYPPSPYADFQHMTLRIDIPDMNTPRLKAVQNLRFVPVGRAMSTLVLDAKLLDIAKVQSSGRSVTFSHDGRTLAVTFEPALPPGEAAEIETTYTVDDPPRGLTWTPESPAWPGRPAQLHTQGQAEDNSYWFPCHDSPNDRLTTELIVTVPSGYLVSSNGRLVAPSRFTEMGRTTFHWLQDKPHVPYLVSLIVGKFDIQNVARAGRDRIPMPVYVPPGRGGDIKVTYGNTPRMVDVFERRTGQAYPWDQYAQLVVWNFSAGGMENTSATTMYDTAIFSAETIRDGDLDGLISHELAHQWFGDLITCKSWEHIWLNEGFATYFTNLWWEERDGRDGYMAGVLGNFDSVVGRDKADAPYQPAMVSKDYRDPWETFRKAANPYPKGASILHMLRVKLGDEVFFRGLAAYVQKFKFREVETNDLRRTLEDVSGESLEQFFEQWCYRPGVPEVHLKATWNPETSELAFAAEQKQTVNGHNPAFAFDLPIWVDAESGSRPLGVVRIDARENQAVFKLPAEPAMIVIDPELSVLADVRFEQPVRRWLAQLERGPTLPARVRAARELAADGSAIGASILQRVAADEREPVVLRRTCIGSLAAKGNAAALATLSRKAIKSRDVREALISEGVKVLAGAFTPDHARLRDVIIAAATKDESERVRAAAVRAIGEAGWRDRLAILIAAAASESQHDRVRQAALEALAALNVPEGLSVALTYAQAGNLNRTRPVAINAAATLAHHNPDVAVPALINLLTDRERRAWEAAGRALVSIGDRRALPALNELRTGKRDSVDAAMIGGWIAEIEAKAKP